MQLDYLLLAESLGIVGRQTMSGELYACCPLHQERNPSFSLNLSTGLWFCHSEGRGGNFEQLVMEINDYSYRQAVRWIYNNGNIVFNLEPDIDPIQEEDILENELEIYRALPERRMSKYWIERGYPLSHAWRWGIRYDMHSRDIWIPYRWPFNGPIIGFIRRTTIPDRRPKYRNTPGLPRNEYLFGYGNIEGSKPPHLLLTEGPFDAMRADSCGYRAAAVLGTYVGEQQIKHLLKVRHDIILAFDSGEEGRKATEATSTLLAKYGIIARAFRFPNETEDRDLDDLSASELADGIQHAYLL